MSLALYLDMKHWCGLLTNSTVDFRARCRTSESRKTSAVAMVMLRHAAAAHHHNGGLRVRRLATHPCDGHRVHGRPTEAVFRTIDVDVGLGADLLAAISVAHSGQLPQTFCILSASQGQQHVIVAREGTMHVFFLVFKTFPRLSNCFNNGYFIKFLISLYLPDTR